MKKFHKYLNISRQGAGILLAISFLSIGVSTVVISYVRQSTGFYSTIYSMVNNYRARELANAGLEASLLVLRSISEEFLFTLGLVANPPRILLDEDCNDNGQCTKYYVSYSIQPEDGKLNLNHLITNNGDRNENYYNICSRLFELLELDVDKLGAIIDWIDENSYESTGGAESQYYEGLNPPRKIKNNYLYSLPELNTIKGFDYNTVYLPHIPADFKEKQEGRASQTESERQLIQDEDWVLANNVTAYLPRQLLRSEAINVNAVRYHVLRSLSGLVGFHDALAIFKLRDKNDGYIKDINELDKLPELQVPGSSGSSGPKLFEELKNTGVSGFLQAKSRFYRITGIGFIAISNDGDADTNERIIATYKVWGIWDKDRNEMIYYGED